MRESGCGPSGADAVTGAKHHYAPCGKCLTGNLDAALRHADATVFAISQPLPDRNRGYAPDGP
jgi:hypothetical protein